MKLYWGPFPHYLQGGSAAGGGDTESCCSSRVEAAAVRRRRRPKVEVFEEVLRRLKEECEEVSEEGFEDELWSHFNRLPLRYI